MDSEARKLQSAVEAGDFGAIPEAVAAYRKSVALQLQRTADTAARRAVLQQAREVLNWSLQLTKAQRARIAARSKAAAVRASAFEAARTSLHTWELEG